MLIINCVIDLQKNTTKHGVQTPIKLIMRGFHPQPLHRSLAHDSLCKLQIQKNVNALLQVINMNEAVIETQSCFVAICSKKPSLHDKT